MTEAVCPGANGQSATPVHTLPILAFGWEELGYNDGMVIHTFAFRWKAGVTAEQKERARVEILALQGQSAGLLETHVGTNFSPRGQGYEFGGVMKFMDRAALEAYGPSSVHQKLLAWLAPLIDAVEVDFEA